MNNPLKKKVNDRFTFSRETLEFALKFSEIGVWYFNIKENITYANPAWYYQLELTPNAPPLTPELFLELIHPDDFKALKSKLKDYRVIDTPKKISYDYRLKTGSGKWKWIRNNAMPFEVSETGEVIAWLGTHTDIDELKSLKESLTEKQSSMNALLMSITNIIYEIDRDYVFINVWANEKTKTKIPKEDFPGKSIREIFGHETANLFEPIIDKAFAENHEIEFEYSLNQRVFRTRTKKFITPHGIERVSMLVEDITEKKIQEKKRAFNEANLQALFENTKDPIIAVDKRGVITNVNKAFRNFYHQLTGEWIQIGKPVPAEQLSQETVEQWLDMHKRALNGEFLTFRNSTETNKQTIYHDFHIGPLINKGIIIGTLVVGREITNLIEATKKAEEAARIKADFLSVMSHEIRTPLNAIIGMCHLLKQEQDIEQIKNDIEVLQYSSQNLLALINDVLDFTKIESGNVDLHIKPFDLVELLRSVKQLMKIKADEKNLKLRFEHDFGIPSRLMGDPNRLQQVLINLIGNAIKYTLAGEVTIQTNLVRKNDKRVNIHFCVKDSGIGIPEDEFDNIFESFSRGKKEDMHVDTGGTGLGLPITKELLRLMGSEIYLESIVGKGSRFYFELEFDIDQSKPSRKKSSLQDVQKPVDLKVLIAEDNEFNTLLITRLLKRWEVEVVACHNGEEAIRIFQETNDLNLILMDIQMPVMDGVEATRIIKNLPAYKKRPISIIAVTAQPDFHSIYSIPENLFDGHLFKPYNPFDLQKILLLHQ